MNLRRSLAVLSLLAITALTPAWARDEVKVANGADARTLDPVKGSDNVSANVQLQMFDNLVFINAQGGLDPMLAESWDRPEPNVFVFHLRKGVKFHNGEECTAEDVKFTLDRALSPEGVMAHALIKGIEKVEIVDKYTVKIVLKDSESPFIYALGESWGGIVSKKAVESGFHDKTPTGTGPFKFVEWIKGDRVVLERFDDYWGDKPSFKRLVIRAIPETSSRTIELESGGIDVAYRVHHTDINRILDNPKLHLLRHPSFRTEYMGMNCAKKPLDDVRVRQAISLAIDTVGMQKAVWRGIGYAPSSPLPKGFPFHDDSIEPPVYDVEKAKELLDEAGVKNLTLNLWTNESKERIDAATIVQNMLAEIGITVHVKVMEYGAFLEGLKAGDHDLYMNGWGNNLPDPEYSFGRGFHTKGMGSNNYSFFSNKEFDDAMDRGLHAVDDADRAGAYKEVQRILLEQVPAIWWSVGETIVATRADITDFDMNARDMSRLWKIRFSD